ncbi:MAG: hypothetical protein PUI42_10215, partial [Lachnospiraceae bacterium]|nr:hypothetical protein [Lachnospiraceae bacterium]
RIIKNISGKKNTQKLITRTTVALDTHEIFESSLWVITDIFGESPFQTIPINLYFSTRHMQSQNKNAKNEHETDKAKRNTQIPQHIIVDN